jgi:hypothetical protein
MRLSHYCSLQARACMQPIQYHVHAMPTRTSPHHHLLSPLSMRSRHRRLYEQEDNAPKVWFQHPPRGLPPPVVGRARPLPPLPVSPITAVQHQVQAAAATTTATAGMPLTVGRTHELPAGMGTLPGLLLNASPSPPSPPPPSPVSHPLLHPFSHHGSTTIPAGTGYVYCFSTALVYLAPSV